MDSQAPIEFIEAEIKKRIESFDKDRNFYREKANQFTLLTAFLSALTTFLIGLSQSYNPSKLVSIIALATSAGMTIVNAWDGLYNYRRRWVQNNANLMRFYELESDIKYEKARFDGNLSLENMDKFRDRYQDILRDANERWREDRLSEPKSK
jgi:hypothetical protein